MKEWFENSFAATMGVLTALLLYSIIVFIVGSALTLLVTAISARIILGG